MPVLLYEMQAQHHHGYRSGMRVEKGECEMNDMVNHPSHYETGKFECFDVMMKALGVEAVKHFCLCNAFKYIYRSQRKNGRGDIEKARWYLDKYIELDGQNEN